MRTAALHGFLRELQAQTITAVITIGEIQRIGRTDGYPLGRGVASMTHRRMDSALIAARAAQARIERKRRRDAAVKDWQDSPIGDLSTVPLAVKPRRILRPVY